MFGKIRLIGLAALCMAIAWPIQANAAEADRPSGLTAISEGNTIVLTWTAATNPAVTEQRVHRLERGKNQLWNRNLASLAVDVTTYTDTAVAPGRKYSYIIEARKPGDKDYGYIGDRLTRPTDHIGIGHWPPHNLAANVVIGGATNEVVLSWTLGTNPNYVRQYVLRRQAKGNWANIADLGDDATTWTDQNVVLGEKYLYAIRGAKANDKGKRSERIAIKVAPPKSPHDLTVSIVDGSVVLAWTPGANPNHVRQVVLRRQMGEETWWRSSDLATDIATWTDTGAMSGEQYFYRVRAEKANGKGGMTRRIGIVVP